MNRHLTQFISLPLPSKRQWVLYGRDGLDGRHGRDGHWQSSL